MSESVVRKERCKCGGFVYSLHKGDSWRFFCSKCHEQTEMHNSHNEAYKAWKEGEREMTELEKLMNERRKIDERIKELKNVEVTYGRAKLGLSHYYTSKPDEWYIAIDRIIDCPATVGRDMKRYSIIRTNDKDSAIEHIDEIIKDLKGLKDKYKGVKK